MTASDSNHKVYIFRKIAQRAEYDNTDPTEYRQNLLKDAFDRCERAGGTNIELRNIEYFFNDVPEAGPGEMGIVVSLVCKV